MRKVAPLAVPQAGRSALVQRLQVTLLLRRVRHLRGLVEEAQQWRQGFPNLARRRQLPAITSDPSDNGLATTGNPSETASKSQATVRRGGQIACEVTTARAALPRRRSQCPQSPRAHPAALQPQAICQNRPTNHKAGCLCILTVDAVLVAEVEEVSQPPLELWIELRLRRRLAAGPHHAQPHEVPRTNLSEKRARNHKQPRQVWTYQPLTLKCSASALLNVVQV